MRKIIAIFAVIFTMWNLSALDKEGAFYKVSEVYDGTCWAILLVDDNDDYVVNVVDKAGNSICYYSDDNSTTIMTYNLISKGIAPGKNYKFVNDGSYVDKEYNVCISWFKLVRR